MTIIALTIDGPRFTIRAEMVPPKPGFAKDPKALQDLQIEGYLVQQFMPRLKQVAEDVKSNLQIAIADAARSAPPPDNLIRFTADPATTSESPDLPPDA